MQLTKDQVNTILQNAPAGSDKKGLLDGLVLRGYDLEGIDSNAIRQSLQPTRTETFGQDIKSDFLGVGRDIISGSQKRAENIQDIKSKMQSGEKGNIPAIFETAGQLAGAGADAIGSVFKGAVKLVLKPKTEERVKGLVTDFGETIMENPQVQGAIKWYDQLPEAQQDALDAVGGFASLASEFIGVGAGKRLATGVKQGVSTGIDTGIDITKQGVKKTSTGISTGLKTVKDTAQDIIPTASDLRDRTLARALRLAPVEDISRIEQATGNKIGEFMNRFELVKDTPAETVDALSKFQKQNYNRVREAIALDDGVYTFKDIPEMQDTIDLLKNDLAGRKSVEYKNAISTLENIENKGQFDLMEVQYVKSLADDVESLYKRSGEVKDSILMQDKAQTINRVRGFIEDRVIEKYPDIDIRALNNNTRTSRAILDAVIKRGSKADTSSFFQLGDLAVLGVGNVQTPGLGYAALFTKKVFESSPIQLRLSRFFSGKANAKQVVDGLTPAKLKELDTLITKELKASIDDVETVSKLQEVQSAIASTNTTKSIPKNNSISKTIPQEQSLINEANKK